VIELSDANRSNPIQSPQLKVKGRGFHARPFTIESTTQKTRQITAADSTAVAAGVMAR
jgi:hypothetical protein